MEAVAPRGERPSKHPKVNRRSRLVWSRFSKCSCTRYHKRSRLCIRTTPMFHRSISDALWYSVLLFFLKKIDWVLHLSKNSQIHFFLKKNWLNFKKASGTGGLYLGSSYLQFTQRIFLKFKPSYPELVNGGRAEVGWKYQVPPFEKHCGEQKYDSIKRKSILLCGQYLLDLDSIRVRGLKIHPDF